MPAYAHPEFLVSPAQLHARSGEPGLVVLDCTTTIVAAENAPFRLISGEDEFRQGHVPGARYVDLEQDLSTPAEGLLFTLPSAEAFGRMATSLGIGRDSFVVTYSTAQPGWAARVWLMLRAFGFTNAAVLDGGFAGWKAAGLPVETGQSAAPSPARDPYPWSGPTNLFVSTEAVLDAKAGVRLVNALPPEVFRGESPVVYGRPGHIPGSANVPTGSLVDPTTGRYLDPVSMARKFSDAGVGTEENVIAYCGAGVAASNVAFARLLLGHSGVSVYDGSMLEWSRDPTRPVVSGAE
jgi:thiosulfate/3-mercaptopyruvate sulfurtransferase